MQRINTLCGGNIESFSVLKQLVHIATTGLYIVKQVMSSYTNSMEQ
jgi:hypothetical protein